MLLWGYLNIAAAIAVALGLWLNIDVKVMGFFSNLWLILYFLVTFFLTIRLTFSQQLTFDISFLRPCLSS